MENCGISPTNDPNVSVLWEQHGSVVLWGLVHKDGPPVAPPLLRVPPEGQR